MHAVKQLVLSVSVCRFQIKITYSSDNRTRPQWYVIFECSRYLYYCSCSFVGGLMLRRRGKTAEVAVLFAYFLK